MAFVSQQDKAKLAPAIKSILKRYKLKGSISVRNHSTLMLTISQGPIDFIRNYNETVAASPGGFGYGSPAKDNLDVNQFWYHEHFTGDAKAVIGELIDAMKGPDFFDHTNAQIDYFHCSHYISLKIGRWNKPYRLEA